MTGLLVALFSEFSKTRSAKDRQALESIAEAWHKTNEMGTKTEHGQEFTDSVIL
jgi:hypothetical protein